MLISRYQSQIGATCLADVSADYQLSRRLFLQRAIASGLSFGAVASLLTACGETEQMGETSDYIDVMNVWSGEEQESFQEVVKPFSKSTGITVTLEVTRDLNDALAMRLQGNNPPDIAILPDPGKMQELARGNYLIPLEDFLDMDQVRKDYQQTWLDLGSYKGTLYALFYKAANKGAIWYSPRQFQQQGYQIPRTWDELIALSSQIAQNGKYPWALGLASSSTSGWPGADWIAEIYLKQFGEQMYDRWVKHEISWLDPSVEQAFRLFGQIVGGPHYIAGAPQSVLSLNYQLASYLPFENPPDAYMCYLGTFAEGFITNEFKKAIPGSDFAFFPFPTLNAQYADAVTGGADVVVALKSTPAVRQLIRYMATSQAQEIWVKRGGFISLNQSVSLNAYPAPVARASAHMLLSAPVYRFGADDLMPSSVEQAFWTAVQEFVKDQSQLKNALTTVERIANEAYNYPA